MLILQAVLAQDCIQYIYTDMPDYKTIQSGSILRITEKGLQEFIRINFELGEQYLAQLQIPDFALNIVSFKLKLSDIIMDSVSSDPPEVHFLNNDISAEAILPNMTMTLKFQFNLQQAIYPYISDHGSGIIRVQSMNIQLQLQMFLNDDCPGRYLIELKDAKSSVEHIGIQMNGNLQLIYDSILYIITQTIQNNFDLLIGNSLIQAVQQIVTENLNGLRPISPTDVYPRFFYDQRLQQIVMKDQQFILYSTGQLCMETSNQTTVIVLSGYYNPDQYSPLPAYYTNSHMQYNLNLLVFQTINNNVLLTNLWDTSRSTLLDAPKSIKFTNTGLVTQMQVQFANTSDIFDVTVFGEIQFISKYFSPNLYLMRAQYTADTIIQCQISNQKCTEDQLQKLTDDFLSQYQSIQNQLSFSYVNSNNIGKCQVLYLNEQWVVGDCNVGAD